MGLDGFEPSTPALSRRCSNQLSYRPASRIDSPPQDSQRQQPISVGTWKRLASLRRYEIDRKWLLPRKEVIQPHLPIRLPCYDFTPVMKLTVVGALLAVTLPASGEPHSHGVTGGVYKTRERIHRDMLIRDY